MKLLNEYYHLLSYLVLLNDITRVVSFMDEPPSNSTQRYNLRIGMGDLSSSSSPSNVLSILKSMKAGAVIPEKPGGNKTQRVRRNVASARQASSDMLSIVCNSLPKGKARTVGVEGTPSSPLASSLKCYQCKSNTSEDLEPMCDNRLFKYLRHSEKARMRVTCGKDREKYCVKITSQKLGQRITERGCFGEEMSYGLNKSLPVVIGCTKFKQEGFLKTVCFCKNNFCNEATKFRIELYVIPILSISILSYVFFM